jgi:hypothetical protein
MAFIACALRNRAESKLLTKNGTLDDQFFRYKCQDLGNGKLQFQALSKRKFNLKKYFYLFFIKIAY